MCQSIACWNDTVDTPVKNLWPIDSGQERPGNTVVLGTPNLAQVQEDHA
jgi:hypothetical protein